MAEINWTSMTSRYIFNLYRALYSFKNLMTTWQKHKIKIIDLKNCDKLAAETNSNALRPGAITYVRQENSLHVQCGDGSTVTVLKLQLEGRKVFTARDFNNGYLKKVSVSERYFE